MAFPFNPKIIIFLHSNNIQIFFYCTGNNLFARIFSLKVSCKKAIYIGFSDLRIRPALHNLNVREYHTKKAVRNYVCSLKCWRIRKNVFTTQNRHIKIFENLFTPFRPFLQSPWTVGEYLFIHAWHDHIFHQVN